MITMLCMLLWAQPRHKGQNICCYIPTNNKKQLLLKCDQTVN